MARSKIGGAYNINQSIVNEAEKLGLDAMATGGGLDYIYKVLGKNEDGSDRVVILGDREDAGSPDYLSSKCELHILLSEDWTDQVSIPVSNARAGMVMMVSIHDPHTSP